MPQSSTTTHAERAPTRPQTGAPATQRLSGEVYGTLINLSGRRRFTSQRVVLYAVLATQGRDGALAMSAEALAVFRAAHAALVDGDDTLPGLYCDELRDAYFGAIGADRVIRAFIALAERVLEAIPLRTRAVAGLLEQLVESATPLLAMLNRVTQVYEDLAKRQASTAKKQLVGVMGEIETIAKQARIVSFNAQVIAARAGDSGREFAVVSAELTQITGKLDGLVREAMRSSVV